MVKILSIFVAFLENMNFITVLGAVHNLRLQEVKNQNIVNVSDVSSCFGQKII